MENLTITKERVLQAAAKCSTAKATLETLFPEAFEGYEYEQQVKIASEIINANSKFPFEWYRAMPGDGSYKKTKLLFENYIKPNLK